MQHDLPAQSCFVLVQLFADCQLAATVQWCVNGLPGQLRQHALLYQPQQVLVLVLQWWGGVLL